MVTPDSGDTLDANGFSIACGYLIGAIGDTWYLQDSVGTGAFIFGGPSGGANQSGTLYCGPGCNLIFGDVTAGNSAQNYGTLIMGGGSHLTGEFTSGNNQGGIVICESGSTVVWGDYGDSNGDQDFGNSGIVIVRAGCNFSWTCQNINTGLIVLEAGATGSFVSLQNNAGGILWICSGATANLLTDEGTAAYGGSWNPGTIVVESEGTLTGDATSGLTAAGAGQVIEFQGAIINGNADGQGGALTVTTVPFVRKSANYPAGASVLTGASGAFSAGLHTYGTYDDLTGRAPAGGGHQNPYLLIP